MDVLAEVGQCLRVQCLPIISAVTSDVIQNRFLESKSPHWRFKALPYNYLLLNSVIPEYNLMYQLGCR